MQWHLASQNRTEARDCTHREQRIAAKLEEIVAHTYAIDSEQIGQDLCQRCLDLGTRSDVLNAAATIAVRCMPHFFGDIRNAAEPIGDFVPPDRADRSCLPSR